MVNSFQSTRSTRLILAHRASASGFWLRLAALYYYPSFCLQPATISVSWGRQSCLQPPFQAALGCGLPLCGAGWNPAGPSHNAHLFSQFEIVTVYYRWHPLYGRSLPVRRRQRFPNGEQVFVQLDNGAACALPEWMLNATCAAMVIGPPLIASDALVELRDLLSGLPSGPECDKASLKLQPKEGRNEVSAEVSIRATQPSLAGSGPIALPAGKDQELIQALIELLLSAASAPAAAEGGNDEPQADR
jgi:hypothetical protein